MNHTITGRCQTSGLEFDPNQLVSIGIRPGRTAWGVFVDSRDLDERANLALEELRFNNQSIHLMVAAAHPDRWLSCFRLQAHLQRKSSRHRPGGAPASKPSQEEVNEGSSATYGLLDALSRCGVNVLDATKALMGYDAVSVVAVCEFPGLRAESVKLMAPADALAIELAKDRPYRKASKATAERIETLQRLRQSAFREIGRRLTNRLALLQARLMLTDELRRLWAEEGEFRLRAGRLTPQSPIATALGATDAGRDGANFGLSKPWFINRAILNLSENPYYLGKHADAPLVRYDDDPRAWAEGGPEGFGDILGCAPSDADVLFQVLFEKLTGRGLKRASQDRDEGKEGRPCLSRFWERILKEIPDPRSEPRGAGPSDKLRSSIIRGVIERAHIFPILVSPMPTLTYARVWALPINQNDGHAEGGKGADGEPVFRAPIAFRFRDAVLQPVTRRGRGGSAARKGGTKFTMRSVYHAMNRWSRLSPMAGEDAYPFNERSMPSAALSASERFLRIRLIRGGSQSMWATVHVGFRTRKGAPDGASRGMLAAMSGAIARLGFRIDNLGFHYDKISKRSEKGFVEFIIQAGSKETQSELDDVVELQDRLALDMAQHVPKTVVLGHPTVYLGFPRSQS